MTAHLRIFYPKVSLLYLAKQLYFLAPQLCFLPLEDSLFTDFFSRNALFVLALEFFLLLTLAVLILAVFTIILPVCFLHCNIFLTISSLLFDAEASVEN